MFTVYQPNDPNCGVGVNEISKSILNMSAFMQDVNTLNVKINSATSGKAFIQIMDLTGRTVFNTTSAVNSGSNNKLINVGSLATGTYIIKATVNGNEITSKVVKF